MNIMKSKTPKRTGQNKVNLRWKADHKAQSMVVSDEEEFEAAILSSLAKQDLCTSKPDKRRWKPK